MAKITSLTAKEILDSRGNPTIEVSCILESGVSGKASVPSGASTGSHEVVELRDGDRDRYGGLGVLKAIESVNGEIFRNIQGKDFEQLSLDTFLIDLDGTKNKARLGANAILGVSMAFARACAREQHIELYEYIGNISDNQDFKLPQPAFNVINGGKHADSGLDIQEFMIAPIGFNSIRRKIQAGAEIIKSLQKLLKDKGHAISVGDEGGFAPKLSSNEEVFDLVEQAIKEAGYSFETVKIAIDVAASEFYKEGKYSLRISGVQKELSSSELIDWYEQIVNNHPIISIEDGLGEDDWQGFSDLRDRLGDKISIVGDDLTVTNVGRIMTAEEKQAINSVLIKLNQIGTLTETMSAVLMTKKQGWAPFVSHRSGETTDTFIADLAVGLSCDYIKSGSLVRGERVSKYNRLMDIENIINNK